ncbi:MULTISPECIES: alpha-glucuronidase family glycosyl hydrolase [unclassified Arenibacter]|uniref:alpha-glucuronidase family glycosyl hydrolase n=1 Tax=unclassified Arenibacter TaxID=2615047 RepID=UPI000E345E55|nr:MULTISPECIES: alpha-glucuronidase family glycosyl hydrolase [unclassified Arenibacter]MCM4162664.1 hypothetical protein [Arenibacter sp. A80]RFT58229.1 hypothetical protein D0S24_03570 [Arenibacter sp. P308M17]
MEGENINRSKSFLLAFILAMTHGFILGFYDHAPTYTDFSSAKIVVAKELTETQKAAIEMLVDEVETRTLINLPVSWEWTQSDPAIMVGTRASFKTEDELLDSIMLPSEDFKEGFTVKFLERKGKAPVVLIIGVDDRGMLYGIGYFLRKVSMKRGNVLIPSNLNTTTHPKIALRGHQLGYRPKTNSYDGFSVKMWEQYIRDLVVFGANAIELLPPFTDDESTSPMFTLPPSEMLLEMVKLLAKYDLEAWIWYPLMHGDYTIEENIEKSLKENSRIFKMLPKIDAIFIPGGDPGHTHPKVLFDYLEKEAKILRQFHPNAEMWLSPQGFNKEWMDEFLQLLQKGPEWLTGVVHGPQVRMSVDEFRKAVPINYPIRRYPDITHNYDAQYPVDEWDYTFAATENRESINPRPISETAIFRSPKLGSYKGFITYSEGVNDDVNKSIWSALGWNPDSDYMETLRDYGRYFIGPDYTYNFAQAIINLENNWTGPLMTNNQVLVSHSIFQEMEKNAPPSVRLNWRFQLALYRSYYDAYNKSRLLYETFLESEAMGILRKANVIGSLEAMRLATDKLDEVVSQSSSRGAEDWSQRLSELAEALFHSIRMQKSVNKYYAAGIRRGANLDLLQYPLNNRFWFKEQFSRISVINNEKDRIEEIDKILNWTNPGPGGFYDDLGDLGNQNHLVKDNDYGSDPSFYTTPFIGYTIGGKSKKWRISWARYAQTLYDQPLKMFYTDLDDTASYQIKVTYTSDLYGSDRKVRLVANVGNEDFEVHSYMSKPKDMQPVIFDIPREATENGQLNLEWTSELGQGGTGRGCQIAEVWLLKKGNIN